MANWLLNTAGLEGLEYCNRFFYTEKQLKNVADEERGWN